MVPGKLEENLQVDLIGQEKSGSRLPVSRRRDVHSRMVEDRKNRIGDSQRERAGCFSDEECRSMFKTQNRYWSQPSKVGNATLLAL